MSFNLRRCCQLLNTLCKLSVHLFWSESKELVSPVQDQVVQTHKHEAVTGQKTDQTEGSRHQQQA